NLSRSWAGWPVVLVAPPVVVSVSVSVSVALVPIVAFVAAIAVAISAVVATIMVPIDGIGNTSCHDCGRGDGGQGKVLHRVSMQWHDARGCPGARLSAPHAEPCRAPPTPRSAAPSVGAARRAGGGPRVTGAIRPVPAFGCDRQPLATRRRRRP